MRYAIFVFVAVCAAMSSLFGDEPLAVDSIRAAVRKSLPFLEKDGVVWMRERDCMSCHHVPFLLWSHHSARRKGIEVDDKKLAEWESWVRDDSLEQRSLFRLDKYELDKLDEATLPAAVKEKLKPVLGRPSPTEADYLAKIKSVLADEELVTYRPLLIKTGTLPINHPARTGGGLDVLAQLLIGSIEPNRSSSVLDEPFRQGLVEVMARVQHDDGSWTPGNQFQSMRQWDRETADQSTTMWAAVALAYADPTSGERSPTLKQAIAYQQSRMPRPDNHEWVATRLLFEKQFGTAEIAAPWRAQLVERQNADGGWGWTKSAASDPYTTGLVLYALSNRKRTTELKADTEHDADNRRIDASAVAYLIGSQQEDGSWRTDSRTISNAQGEERIAARNEIYHYWGTAWAVVGMLETIP